LAGKWTHWAFVKNADTGMMYIYQNGKVWKKGGNKKRHIMSKDIEKFRIGTDGTGSRYYYGWIDDFQLYNDEVTASEMMDIMQGPPNPESATSPVPGKNAKNIAPDELLTWNPGDSATVRNVFIGTNPDDVANATVAAALSTTVMAGLTKPEIDPNGAIKLAQTYYWRVDEIIDPNDPNTVTTGTVWSFSTEPTSFAIKKITATASGSDDPNNGPQNTVNGSGMNAEGLHSTEAADMWLSANDPNADWIQFEFDKVYPLAQIAIWNYNTPSELFIGMGAKDVTIETSMDANNWTALTDVEIAKAPSTPSAANTTIAVDNVLAKFVKITIKNNRGPLNMVGLSEVKFSYAPIQARKPQPGNGAKKIENTEFVLGWSAGQTADAHQIYFSTDEQKVASNDPCALIGNIARNRTATKLAIEGSLDMGTTYYWKVNEVIDPNGTNTVLQGNVWSFTTKEFTMVDDFDAYNDDNPLYVSWRDGMGYREPAPGYAGNGTGSIVANATGSMPLTYNNSICPMYSEASRTWTTPQDLTAYDANVVALWIKGSPTGASLTETATGLKLKASGRDIWGRADRFGYAYKKLSGDGSITVKVNSLATFEGISAWAKAGVMIRETADAGSPQAMLCVTPVKRAAFQYRIKRNQRSFSSHMGANSIAMPQWLKLTRTGDVFEALHSADGTTWEAVGGKNKDTIPMSTDVLIGLSITPQNIKPTEAEYSEITIEGAVTGDWTTEDVGNAFTFNTPDTLYIIIEDASGNAYTAVHPDGTAVVVNTAWQQWILDAADITAAGVDLSAITKISIGVGSKDAPVQGGTGKVYIDEISFGKPIPVVAPVQE